MTEQKKKEGEEWRKRKRRERLMMKLEEKEEREMVLFTTAATVGSTVVALYIKKEEQSALLQQWEATTAEVCCSGKNRVAPWWRLSTAAAVLDSGTFQRQLLTIYQVIAQKLSFQLEKEALDKGIPIGQALDIDIPPPRPKRKPSNPYPRKTGLSAPLLMGKRKERHSSSISSLCLGNQILDLEKDPVPEARGVDKKRNEKDTSDENNCSEVFVLYQDAPCSSMSSASKDPPTKIIENSCTFREFVPLTKEVVNQDEKNKVYNACESKETRGIRDLKKLNVKPVLQEDDTTEAFIAEKYCCWHDKSVQTEKKEAHKPEMLGVLQTNEMLPTQSYPRHVPVYVINGSQGVCTQNFCQGLSYHESGYCLMGGGHGQPGSFTDSAICVPMEHQNNVPSSPSHQASSTFHPLTTVNNNQEEFQPYLQMSSTFSSLIVSTLLQNPAAHAAASFAASIWPFTSVEASADSPGGITGFSSRSTSSTPATMAVAAATVTAATAWWAAHGLLPLCCPIHNGFTCTPTSAATPTNNGQTAEVINETNEDNLIEQALQDEHHLDPESSEAFQAQQSGSKSPTMSSTGSEEGRAAKLANRLIIADHEKATAVTELHDLSKTKGRKQVDRSSCGSNTPSSSEVETDALGKHEKGKQDSKEPDIINPTSESSNRRSRSTSNTSESWKEVSEEGRLAFQALFSREVLPQSFSPPHDLKNKGVKKSSSAYENKQNDTEKDAHSAQLDLIGKTSGTYNSHPELKGNTMLRIGENHEGGLLTGELGHAKVRARRTGFKPYKRCSLEAKESRMGNAGAQGEEKGPKRVRLEGDAST
ncbi:hypothetical protein RJ641_016329 [Dillenia turbinata]|uniref:Uncharacterized protein n=1 Tax=Dillenia turbinata TaxID=194707 RepID=A0AAN8UR46_9MAGN